tara:strand:- start:262 stop:690 length:429 start_codon:yes stop_codon:yes gene_type:complete
MRLCPDSLINKELETIGKFKTAIQDGCLAIANHKAYQQKQRHHATQQQTYQPTTVTPLLCEYQHSLTQKAKAITPQRTYQYEKQCRALAVTILRNKSLTQTLEQSSSPLLKSIQHHAKKQRDMSRDWGNRINTVKNQNKLNS